MTVDATELARNPKAQPFLVQPDDAVTVPYIKKWVTVLGEVQKPGTVTLPTEGDLDLLGAIALASGYTPDADPTRVEVRRSVGNAAKTTVSVRPLMKHSSVAFRIDKRKFSTAYYLSLAGLAQW